LIIFKRAIFDMGDAFGNSYAGKLITRKCEFTYGNNVNKESATKIKKIFFTLLFPYPLFFVIFVSLCPLCENFNVKFKRP